MHETRAELAQHLTDAARVLRLAMAAGRALGSIDADWVSVRTWTGPSARS
ncbi:hypothetical protein [Micromonospora sp. NPDC047134]